MRPGARGVAVLTLMVVGCDARTPIAPPPNPPTVPLSIRRPEGIRVFPGDEEFGSTFPFEGARGSVRVSMEVATSSGEPGQPAPKINDVLFRAVGDGQVAIRFKRPWPGHPEGRVTISCASGGEESSAEFEPAIWLAHPSSIVAAEPTPNDPAHPAEEEKEIVLIRYVARNIPVEIRLTLKAVFSREPVPPRIKAGARPPR